MFQALVREGPTTRARLAERVGLSKPTVSAIVRDLEGGGWIAQTGRTSGGVGRAGITYGLVPRARHVVGVDLGGTALRAAVAGLDGAAVGEARERTRHGSTAALLDQIAALCRRTADESGSPWSTVEAVALGAPGAVDPRTGVVRLSPNVPSLVGVAVADALAARLDVPVLAENDVNLAALGERWEGHARGVDDVVFVAVGTGLGMGIVVDGDLRRGAHGAAGELAFLPLAADPLDPVVRQRGALEHFAAGPGIAARYAARTGRPTRKDALPAILDAAEAGERAAQEVLDETGRAIAEALTAIVALLDPTLIVLGGGIGTRPAVDAAVRRWAERLLHTPVPIRRSALGERAALAGATGVALREAHRTLFAGRDGEGARA